MPSRFVEDEAATTLSAPPTFGFAHPTAEQDSLDRFEILSKLGSGGMATVFLARDKKTGDRVALKVIENNDVDDARVARFHREVSAAGRVAHENVCRVTCYGSEPGKLFMAMELVEGETLQKLVRENGVLPVAIACELMRQLLQALAAAHAAGVVHRDLKPANVMITRHGVLKLVDFGIAKSQEDETVTATGMLIGTPAFMSPEQILGKGVDGKSDVFSAAATMLVMLTGKHRFAGMDPTAVMIKVAKEPFAPLLELAPFVSVSLDRFFAALSAADVDKRVSAAAAVELIKTVDELPSDGAALLLRYLAQPGSVTNELTHMAARVEVLRAERLLGMGPAGLPAAALALHRATLLDPAEGLLRRLSAVCQEGRFTFEPLDDPRLHEVLATLEEAPRAPGPLKRAADLSRAQGHLQLAATFLLRYLREKPSDSAAQHQLNLLLEGPAPAAGTQTNNRLSTRDIMAGVKTAGGIDALALPASLGKAPPASTMTVPLPGLAARDPITRQPLTQAQRRAQGLDGPAPGSAAQPPPTVFVSGGVPGDAGLNIHPLLLVVGAVVVAGIVIALFGSFMRAEISNTQRAADANLEGVRQLEDATITTMRANALAEARGHSERKNWDAAIRSVNLLLATKPSAELVADGLELRARAHTALGSRRDARADLEEFLRLTLPTDPRREQARVDLDAIYRELGR